MPSALAPTTPRATPADRAPLALGYTPDQMPVVIWHRNGDPVLEVGCVQIRLVRLTDGLCAGLAECLQPGGTAGTRPARTRS